MFSSVIGRKSVLIIHIDTINNQKNRAAQNHITTKNDVNLFFNAIFVILLNSSPNLSR